MVGINRFQEILNKYSDRPVLLYGDPDFDGLESLYLMVKWFQKYFPNKQFSYYVNDNRYHGISIGADRLKGFLVISADFTITEKEMQAYVDNDVAFISTDHHECQDEFIDIKGATAEGIVINNQYPFEPEEDRYLSGAGVWYELICSMYPDFKCDEYDALVGITLLTDIRAIENKKAKAYLKKTFTSDTSQGYIHYLIESTKTGDFGFGTPKLDRNFIDFTLSPFVNALLRFNRTADAVDFILGKGLKVESPRGTQRSLVEAMSSRCKALELVNVDILSVNTIDFDDFNASVTGFIGLFASNWADSHGRKSVLAYAVENGKVVRASFRGKYDDIHYRTSFRGLGIHAEGHPSAFGILDFEPDPDLLTQVDDVIGDLEATHSSTVTVLDVSNLALWFSQRGLQDATNNCYCRDMYRTYLKYNGENIKIIKQTYKLEELTAEELNSGIIPDTIQSGINYKYIRDIEGNPIPKYIEYLVDGRQVKSFGVSIEDGLILPILDKGYIQLQVRNVLV